MTRRGTTRLAAACSLALALVLGVASPAAGTQGPGGADRPRWDTDVFALVPAPGFPAHAYVGPNGRVYVGTYTNPAGDRMRSRVLEYEADGTLLRSWTMRGQDLSGEHGVQAATMTARGRLILLDRNPPRVLRLNRRTGAQRTLARFPRGTVPNYAAWGVDGALYVTDYAAPRIWRVPPGGGTPEPWLEDPELDGGTLGTTSISLTADRRAFMVAQTSAAGGRAGNPTTGRLLHVPVQPDGRPGPVRRLWESRPFDGVDGFALGRSGLAYVALLASNQIVVVGPDGVERERFPATPLLGDNGSPVPFDAPSSVRFLGTRLMVANQAYLTGDPAHQAILDVEAGERGLEEHVPRAPRRERGRKRRP